MFTSTDELIQEDFAQFNATQICFGDYVINMYLSATFFNKWNFFDHYFVYLGSVIFPFFHPSYSQNAYRDFDENMD